MTETAVAFDPFEEGFVEWPYDQYARLRAAEPVHRSDLLQGWVLTRYEDIATLLKDPTLSVEIDNATPNDITKGEIARRHEQEQEGDERGMTLVLLDDPEHARIRKLMAPPFRARSIEGWREMIRTEVDLILDRIVPPSGEPGSMDVLTDFAYPLPVTVFCRMLGFPDEDSPKFRFWTQCVAKNLDPVLTPEEREECTRGTDEMYEYLEQQIVEVQDDPRDDLLTQLVFATDDDGRRLTHGELLAQLITLYVAGHEPTTALIGNGLLGLLRQPDQLAQLQGDIDGLLVNAVLELLRFDGPNQFVRRVAMRETRLGDAVIQAGDVLYVSLAAANHDPERWGATADEIDVDRPDAKSHLQLGAGIHACLGGHLARVQAEVALGELLRRCTDLELAGEPTWSERMVLRSVATLPVRFTAT